MLAVSCLHDLHDSLTCERVPLFHWEVVLQLARPARLFFEEKRVSLLKPKILEMCALIQYLYVWYINLVYRLCVYIYIYKSYVYLEGVGVSLFLRFWILQEQAFCQSKKRGEFRFQVYIPRTQITRFLEDLTHKMEGQPPKKRFKWVTVTGIYMFWSLYGLYLSGLEFDFGGISRPILKSIQSIHSWWWLWRSWWNKSCTSWYGRFSIVYRGLYIPGGCLGVLPSTVFPWVYHLPQILLLDMMTPN